MKPAKVWRRSGLAFEADSNGVTPMILDGRSQPCQATRDRKRQHARLALEIALAVEAVGPIHTLSWIAAGMPDDGTKPEQVQLFRTARAIVRENNQTIGPGDADRVLAELRKRKAGASK
jgi:hypothetical protein